MADKEMLTVEAAVFSFNAAAWLALASILDEKGLVSKLEFAGKIAYATAAFEQQTQLAKDLGNEPKANFSAMATEMLSTLERQLRGEPAAPRWVPTVVDGDRPD